MTDMTEQTMWLIGGGAVLVAALIGFFVGRSPLGGKTRQVAALEAEVSRQQDEIAGYKRDVESHFDKTATLVASMAGSYKDLFEHLSSGYEQLSSGSARQLFRDRVVALLVGSAGAPAAADLTPSDKVSAALIAAGAPPLEPSSTAQAAASEQSAAAGAAAEAEAKEIAANTEGAPAREAENSRSQGSMPPAADASKPDGEEPASAEGHAEPTAAGVAGDGGPDGAEKATRKPDNSATKA